MKKLYCSKIISCLDLLFQVTYLMPDFKLYIGMLDYAFSHLPGSNQESKVRTMLS